jgi:uncharacterized protein
MKYFLLLFTYLCIVNFSFSQIYYSPSEIPNPKDNSDGFISDPQDYINESDENTINELIEEVRQKKGFEIAVAVIESIDGNPALEFATELINLWGVGKGDRGILLLIAVGDREMAFATGYETEQYIPDLVTKQISEEEIVPYFKSGNYSLGIQNGVLAIRNIVLDENVPAYIEQLKEFKNDLNVLKIALIIAIAFFILLALLANSQAKVLSQLLIMLAITFFVSSISFYAFKENNIASYSLLDIMMFVGYLVYSIGCYLIIRKDSLKRRWIKLVFQLVVASTIIFGCFVFKLYSLLIVYAIGASIVFGVFLIVFLITFSVKDSYRKFHILQVFKLDIFKYLFPFPMLFVDEFVEYKLENWRNQVRFSLKTGLEMTKLCETYEDKYLESGHITEEKIKSVDYDVWVSSEPDDFLILSYKTWFSGFSSCEKCNYQTWFLEYDRTITPASYTSSGTGESKKSCHHCKHSVINRYTIPMKEKSSSSSGSSRSSFSGGGGGSWGGGRSGGGGSSSKW